MSGAPNSLYKIVNGLRYFGVGSKVVRKIWKFPDTYYIITRVNLSTDQNHGKAFGRLVWRGVVKPKDERIPSTLKEEWTMLELPSYHTFKGSEECVEEVISAAKKVEKPYGKLAQQQEQP